MIIAKLLGLLGLTWASVQDYRTGKISSWIIYTVFTVSLVNLVGLGMPKLLTNIGILAALILSIKVSGVEWGRADNYALYSITLLSDPASILSTLTIIFITCTTYALYMEKKNRELYIIPAITLGYLISLILQIFT